MVLRRAGLRAGVRGGRRGAAGVLGDGRGVVSLAGRVQGVALPVSGAAATALKWACACNGEWSAGLERRERRCDSSSKRGHREGAGSVGLRVRGCAWVVGASAEATVAAMRGVARLPSRFYSRVSAY